MLRIVFFGTPEFALPGLSKLYESGYEIAAVVTAPDKERGRGLRVHPPPVKQFALKNGLRVLQPENLRDPSFVGALAGIDPDIIVVIAYRILPREIFTIPKQGAFNLHASLLPRYRGAAPINWAIINGETETGVTTFFIEEKIDTGRIILQSKCPIGPDETAGELHDKLSLLGSETVFRTVEMIERGEVTPAVQDDSQASRAPKLTRDICVIDWSKPAAAVHNLIRGLSPVPAAFSYLEGHMIKFYRSEVGSPSTGGSPGTIISADDELIVAAGDGALRITELQREGKKRLDFAKFLRGYALSVGTRFTPAPEEESSS